MRRTRPIDREEAFEGFITDIDARLREEGTPIPDRPFAAVMAAAQITGGALRPDVADRNPTSGVYRGDDLVIRIHRWYQRHYGSALGPAVRIESEEEFLKHMEEIDQRLKSRDIPIPGRPIAAIGEFASLLKEELRGYPLDRDPMPGRYTGDDLVINVERWYEERYGTRILMDNKDGEVVVLLRGDPWVLELPLILGGGGGPRFVCEYGRPTTLPNKPQVYRLGDPLPPPTEYNVLDSIKDLPDGLAKSLTGGECEEILDAFVVGREAYTTLRRSGRSGLLALVQGDLEAAVSHLSGNARQTGLSKWASLQATEKILKAFLEQVRGSYTFSHKLSDLVEEAVALGLPTVNSFWIHAIQCPAGVRYGEPAVSLEDAVNAHHASLRVVAHVAGGLPPLTASQ